MVLAFLGAVPGRHYDALKHAGPLAKAKITKKRETCKLIIIMRIPTAGTDLGVARASQNAICVEGKLHTAANCSPKAPGELSECPPKASSALHCDFLRIPTARTDLGVVRDVTEKRQNTACRGG
jgi:hypothetical protein